MKDNKTITLRIPSALKKEILSYTERHGTTLTQFTLDYYRKVLALEDRQEAEQM